MSTDAGNQSIGSRCELTGCPTLSQYRPLHFAVRSALPWFMVAPVGACLCALSSNPLLQCACLVPLAFLLYLWNIPRSFLLPPPWRIWGGGGSGIMPNLPRSNNQARLAEWCKVRGSPSCHVILASLLYLQHVCATDSVASIPSASAHSITLLCHATLSHVVMPR